MQVEIWSDVVCPWCYLGKRRFETALEQFEHRDEVEVVYRSFELDPSAERFTTAPVVEVLAERYGMTEEQASDAQHDMEDRAELDGLDFDLSDLQTGNPRDAHRLLHLAKDRARQPELAEILHRAYFSEQKSVFDAESLTRLAEQAGLDPAEVRETLESNAYDEAVEDDEALAASFGANGVPFFVIDRRYGMSGAQPVGAMAAALREAWSAEN